MNWNRETSPWYNAVLLLDNSLLPVSFSPSLFLPRSFSLSLSLFLSQPLKSQWWIISINMVMNIGWAFSLSGLTMYMTIVILSSDVHVKPHSTFYSPIFPLTVKIVHIIENDVFSLGRCTSHEGRNQGCLLCFHSIFFATRDKLWEMQICKTASKPHYCVE